MDALLVVHTEVGYNPISREAIVTEDNQLLFDRIAQEIGASLEQNKRVYYLADGSDSHNNVLMYPPIKDYSHNMVFIPSDNYYMKQFLMCKKLLIKDNVLNISLTGITYPLCITDIYYLLLGEEGPHHAKEDFEEISRRLGWSKKKFEQVFNKRFNTHIIDNLTDKVNSSVTLGSQ